MSLTLEDLREVRSLLYSVRRKWYSIGIELQLKIGELDTIKATYSDPGECLTEMIKIWLKSVTPSPTWEALKDALTSEPVDEVALAKKIPCPVAESTKKKPHQKEQKTLTQPHSSKQSTHLVKAGRGEKANTAAEKRGPSIQGERGTEGGEKKGSKPEKRRVSGTDKGVSRLLSGEIEGLHTEQTATSSDCSRKNTLVRCSSCGQEGHTKRSKDCPSHNPIQAPVLIHAPAKGNLAKDKTSLRCSECGQEGHTKRSKECPSYSPIQAPVLIQAPKTDSSIQTQKQAGISTKSEKTARRCSKCRQEGHTKQSKECPLYTQAQEQTVCPEKAPRRCSKCGQAGHTKQSRECSLYNSTQEQEEIPTKSAKPPRKCGACGETGHTRQSKECPLHNETQT